MIRWLFAAAHLLALGIGLGAVWARARALQGSLDPAGLRRVFVADTWWGVAAGLWLGTGLVRLLAGLEKPTAYYLGNHLFWTKMGLFVLVVLVELWPMVTLIRWRSQLRRGEPLDIDPARRMAQISFLEVGLVLLILLAATGMARGYGFGGHSGV